MRRILVFCVSIFAMLVFIEWNAAVAAVIDINAYSTGSSKPWNQIPSLINTLGNVNTGVSDTHWQVRLIPGADATAYAVSSSYMNTTMGYKTIPGSLWITPGNPVVNQGAGVFVYTTSLSVPTNYSLPLIIEGMFLSDNGIQEVRLNGSKVLGPYLGGTLSETTYSVKLRANPGNNTLEFFVNNQTDSFTGFDNKFTKVQAVPEPCTCLLSICGASISIVISLRSTRGAQAKGKKGL